MQSNNILLHYIFLEERLHNIYADYKEVTIETAKEIRDKPIKSAAIFGAIGTLFYLNKHKPTESDYTAQITVAAQDLMMVGDPIRNQTSDKFVQNVNDHINKGTLRCMNLGVLSLIWYDNFSKEVDVFEAHAGPLKVGWLDMKERILDIGILDRWIKLEEAMMDYDINPDEWKELEISSQTS